MDLSHLSSQLKLKTNFNAGSTGIRDLNSITGIVDNSVTSLQALIFSNSNPEYDDIDVTNLDTTGIKSGYSDQAFIFDIKKEYKYTLGSNITDHYVEDNLAIQDQIGLKPIILEVTGCIGELSLSEVKNKEINSKNIASEIGVASENQNNAKGNIFNSVDSYLGRMGSLTSFAPNLANQAYDIYNTAKFGYSTASKVINLGKKDTVGKSGYAYTEQYDVETIRKTKQFYWIDWFRTQWWKRASFTIVTPYGVLGNMFIMELSASQPENTRYVTNLNIKFKQIRKAIVISEDNKYSQTMETQMEKITEHQGEVDTDLIIANEAWYGGASHNEFADLSYKGKNNQQVGVGDDKYAVNKSNNTSVISFNVKGATKSKSIWSRLINQMKGKK